MKTCTTTACTYFKFVYQWIKIFCLWLLLNQSFPVRPGDWIVVATDGLWDNLYDSQIIEILDGCDHSEAAANKIAKLAFRLSLDE